MYALWWQLAPDRRHANKILEQSSSILKYQLQISNSYIYLHNMPLILDLKLESKKKNCFFWTKGSTKYDVLTNLHC